MSDPGSLEPLLVGVNTCYDVIEHDKCCSICYVYYMYVVFIIRQCPDIYEMGKHAFPKIYLNIKMSVFEAKQENCLAGFISKNDRIYVS